MRTLYLTLKKSAFDVMVTGEKEREYRKPSKWIESRLFDKNGKWRQYDFIRFTNGYGKDKPYFIAKFLHAEPCTFKFSIKFRFSNGLEVEVERGDYSIIFREIIEKGNLK